MRAKKRPRWLLRAATEADQPGMGMTNRVIPAQGEERGASYTLIWLDGDTSRKFQPVPHEIFLTRPECGSGAMTTPYTSDSAPNGGNVHALVRGAVRIGPNAASGGNAACRCGGS